MEGLTATERKILVSALSRYRIAKSAEGKLAYQKALPKRPLFDDCTEANSIKARYSALIAQIECMEGKLACS